MSDKSVEPLRSLQHLTKSQLRDVYTRTFKKSPDFHWGKRLLLRFVSYKVQEQGYRGLKPSAQSRLRQLASELNKNSRSDLACSRRLKPGTRLVREWRGQVHSVTVNERQYEYKGSNYDSLSEIARLITGTRWSGPAFFGLQQKLTAKTSSDLGS